MAGDEKDGYYCSICGGIPPDKIKTRRILIDGTEIVAEIMKRVKVFNYVPTKKADRYAEALLIEYRQKETQ